MAGAGKRHATTALATWMGVALAHCAPSPARNAASSFAPGAVRPSLQALRAWENEARRTTDFALVTPSDVGLGPDPYVIRARPGALGHRAGVRPFVGILRGSDAVVELDASLSEVARHPAPASPSGLAVAPNGDVYVVGELSSRVARFKPVGEDILPDGATDLGDVRAMRDIAVGPEGVAYVVEEHDGRLIAFRPAAAGASAPVGRKEVFLCHGPHRVARRAHAVVVNCILDHTIVIRAVDTHGYPVVSGEVRIVHDGPMWGMDAVDTPGGLLLAVGGVEDHPLDRTGGSFGYVDSFVTLYRVADGSATKLAEVNTSAVGVLTPKAIHLARDTRGGIEIVAAGYGSDRFVTIDWVDGAHFDAPAIRLLTVPPGNASIADAGDGSFALANPLLDAWVLVAAGGAAVVPVAGGAEPRSAASRVGEALFFTNLMAPWNRSDGRLSRFTCETCHFEGYVDGRTHRTGRGDIMATTKPLLGLFGNRPHFSRALDPDMTTMVDNEFRVAGAKSGHDAWFSVSRDDFPWTGALGVGGASLGPADLREALMRFLMDFNHRPNPAVVGRESWTDVERSGAGVFARKCESCHAARLVADDPATHVPFDGWERLIFARQGAIVWARADYAMTGVRPYVSERGARIVSLRRLYKKHPYFTNGSAGDVDAVLGGVRFAGDRFFHADAPPDASQLSDGEKEELSAFLDLL